MTEIAPQIYFQKKIKNKQKKKIIHAKRESSPKDLQQISVAQRKWIKG